MEDGVKLRQFKVTSFIVMGISKIFSHRYLSTLYKGWTKTTATASHTREQRSLAVRHQTKNEVHSITYR